MSATFDFPGMVALGQTVLIGSRMAAGDSRTDGKAMLMPGATGYQELNERI
jgi:hypothetical protein